MPSRLMDHVWDVLVETAVSQASAQGIEDSRRVPFEVLLDCVEEILTRISGIIDSCLLHACSDVVVAASDGAIIAVPEKVSKACQIPQPCLRVKSIDLSDDLCKLLDVVQFPQGQDKRGASGSRQNNKCLGEKCFCPSPGCQHSDKALDLQASKSHNDRDYPCFSDGPQIGQPQVRDGLMSPRSSDCRAKNHLQVMPPVTPSDEASKAVNEGCENRKTRSPDSSPRHLNRSFPCQDCDYVAKTKQQIKLHKKQIHDLRLHETRILSSQVQMVKKARKKLSSEPMTCEECGKSFANKCLYKQHQDTHITTNDVMCETCGRGFKNKRYLMSHIKHVHSNEKYLCVDCGKEFKQASGYRQHRKMIHPKAPIQLYRCEYCDKVVRNKMTLKSHHAIVHGRGEVKVLHCEQCPTKFVSESKLREHVLAKHLGVKHPCPSCGKEFNHKFSMTKHFREGKCASSTSLARLS